MSLSLSPNSLYCQTTDCIEGGSLTREHCMILKKSASAFIIQYVSVALINYIQFQLDIESFQEDFPTFYSGNNKQGSSLYMVSE